MVSSGSRLSTIACGSSRSAREVVGADDVPHEILRRGVLDDVERPPVGGDRVEPELAGEVIVASRARAVAVERTTKRLCSPQAVVVRRLGEDEQPTVGGEAAGGAVGGDRGNPECAREPLRREEASVGGDLPDRRRAAGARRRVPDVAGRRLHRRREPRPRPDCPRRAGCAQHGGDRHDHHVRDTRISASLDRHDRYTGSVRSVPFQVRSRRQPRYHVGRAPTMSRLLSVEKERIAVFYVCETGREGGLAVKRFRLSGAALAVVALGRGDGRVGCLRHHHGRSAGADGLQELRQRHRRRHVYSGR